MRISLCCVFALLGLGLNGQLTHPKASPFATVTQQVGLTTIKVAYSRPAVRGRHVFGPRKDGLKGLVPYGRIWRLGANQSTKITVDTDFKVLGHALSKGTYALYAFPEEGQWQIAFHNNITHWGDGRKNYDAKEDACRIVLAPKTIPYHQENFLVAFDSITHNTAQLQFTWATTRLSIPITVDTEAQMEAEILKQIKANPTAQTYYEAARYLQEQGKDYRRALGYLDKALALDGDTYYFLRVKSLVQAALSDYKGAIVSAQKSMAIAAQLEKDEFVLLNQKNIKKWQQLLQGQR